MIKELKNRGYKIAVLSNKPQPSTDKVYEKYLKDLPFDMVVGENPKLEDIVVNVCKRKNLTNTRSSASDEALRLITPKQMSLEEAIEFIADDELLEVTPKSIRIRKKILDARLRYKANKV